jgi:hypothetical protein
MPFAINTEPEKEQQLVSVFKAILGIHSCHVDLNVLKITTVQQIECARIKNVSIPAQDCVVSMLFAQFRTIDQAVIVSKVTRVTPQSLVT